VVSDRDGDERAADTVGVKKIEHPAIVVDMSRIPDYYVGVVHLLIVYECVNVA